MTAKKVLYLVIVIFIINIPLTYSGEYFYHLHDHLGNTRVIVDEDANVVESYDYYPFGMVMRSNISDNLGTIHKFTGKELDDEHGLDWYYFGARFYDPEIGRFLGIDPYSDAYPSWTPYQYGLNNPVIYFDFDGRSTVTDSSGNVIHVNTEDSDFSVYQTTTVQGGINELGIPGGSMSVKTKVGETENIDEFIDPETGEAGGTIMFGESWGAAIDALHSEAKKMDLKDIASNSTKGRKFDIKANEGLVPHGKMTGKLLNNKYATARSAGNYLAGYNARHGTYLGARVSWTTFMKMAGALHTGNWSKGNAIKIFLLGKSYGPAPWYGEIPYAGRMIKAGWNRQ